MGYAWISHTNPMHGYKKILEGQLKKTDTLYEIIGKIGVIFKICLFYYSKAFWVFVEICYCKFHMYNFQVIR